MNCCSECFSSSYLKRIIHSDTRKGDCDFCSSKNVSIYSPRELLPFFRNLLNLYEIDNENGNSIDQAIILDFGSSIFDEKVDDQLNLLKYIVSDEFEEFKLIFDNSVSLKINRDSHKKLASEIHSTWEKFKDEIKNVNRFHIQNTIDLSKLSRFFKNEAFNNRIVRGRIFYRGRISDKIGFDLDYMGNPPKDVATAGRANPKGISYLYLGDQLKTSLYETRATLFDFVTVGEFRLNEDINILNLRAPLYDPISWSEEEALEDYLIYIPFIQTLQRELSLPIRRLDKEIDYLPTQYLSEFIKSIGFDGVEFQSSLYSDGYNLAIFQPKKFECIKAEVYEIEKIDLIHKKV